MIFVFVRFDFDGMGLVVVVVVFVFVCLLPLQSPQEWRRQIHVFHVVTIRPQTLHQRIPAVSEDVFFSVNEDSLRNIIQEFLDFAKPGGNGDSINA